RSSPNTTKPTATGASTPNSTAAACPAARAHPRPGAGTGPGRLPAATMAAAISNGECITRSHEKRIQSLRWGFPSKRHSRPPVEHISNLIQLHLRITRKIRALRQELPNQAVRVLITPTLPRRMRVTEVHRNVRRDGELPVR